jgi:hypothetical protein
MDTNNQLKKTALLRQERTHFSFFTRMVSDMFAPDYQNIGRADTGGATQTANYPSNDSLQVRKISGMAMAFLP